MLFFSFQVWFKNRRLKWRKDTREWTSVKKTPVSGHLHDNFSQAILSTDQRSLHSKVQNLQEPSLMTSDRSTMSHTANGDGLYGYSEEGMSGAASSLLKYSSFCQSQFHLPNKVPVVFNDLGAVSQTQHAVHSKVSWMDTLIDLQADLYLFPEGDQELPKLQEEQVHSQLDQLDGSQSTDPWLVTAGHMSNTNQTKDLGDTSQMNQSFVPQPSSPRIATTGHMSDTTQKKDLGCTRQMYRPCGPPSTSPSEITTTGNVSDAHSKLVLGASSQIPLRDWEVEAHLDDLMEIIAKEGFIASPELNSVR